MNYPSKRKRRQLRADAACRWSKLCDAYRKATSFDTFKIEADLLNASFIEKMKFKVYYMYHDGGINRILLYVIMNIMIMCGEIAIWFAAPNFIPAKVAICGGVSLIGGLLCSLEFDNFYKSMENTLEVSRE